MWELGLDWCRFGNIQFLWSVLGSCGSCCRSVGAQSGLWCWWCGCCSVPKCVGSHPGTADILLFHSFDNWKWCGGWYCLILRISLICLQPLLLQKNWSDPEARQVSVPLMATDRADGDFESDVPTSHLGTATVDMAILVTAICPVLVMMLLEIGRDRVELGVHILGGIFNNSSTLLVWQRLLTIRCQNRFLSSFQ